MKFFNRYLFKLSQNFLLRPLIGNMSEYRPSLQNNKYILLLQIFWGILSVWETALPHTLQP